MTKWLRYETDSIRLPLNLIFSACTELHSVVEWFATIWKKKLLSKLHDKKEMDHSNGVFYVSNKSVRKVRQSSWVIIDRIT